MSPQTWTFVAFVVFFLWFMIDLQFWKRFSRRRMQLDHEGRWEELDALFRKELRSLRPWTRLVLALKAPGALQVLYSNFLIVRGRPEESLRYAEDAAHRASGRDAFLHEQALACQALALTDLGRYDEARAALAAGRALAPDSPQLGHVDAFNHFALGQLNEAFLSAKRVIQNPKGDVTRGLLSQILLAKGEFPRALEVLLDRPQDVRSQYPQESLQTLQRTSSGRDHLEAHQRQWAGVVQPLRYIHAAYIYLDLGDLDGLRFSLEKAAEVQGGAPPLKIIHRQLLACLRASTGDAAGAEQAIREAEETLRANPKRALEVELHRFKGRVCLLLGRSSAAIAEFEAALQGALHPIEKHIARYWLARGWEAAGDPAKAGEFHRAVAADGFPSRYAAEAAKASPR